MLLNKTITIPVEDFLNQGQYTLPQNTPTTPLIDFSLSRHIAELNENLKAIGKSIYYLTHPKQLLLILWSCTVEYSYLICLLICVAGVIAYILGHKKDSKWITGSIVGYTIIQAINSAL